MRKLGKREDVEIVDLRASLIERVLIAFEEIDRLPVELRSPPQSQSSKADQNWPWAQAS